METKVLAGVVIVIVVVLALAVVAFNSGSSPSTGAVTTTLNTSSGGQQAQLFSSSQYYQNSHLISGNATLSASGQAATSDFNITSTALSNASVEYTLVFVGTHATYNVTLAPGDSLYYIDSTLGDDSPSADSFHLDDGYVVVNSSGYIVSQVYPLPSS